MKQTNTPPPGSVEAIALGCTCPVGDNGHGRGAAQSTADEKYYWIVDTCPIRGRRDEL